MPPLRRTNIRSLRREMLEHYLGGATHDAAVLYDIDEMTLTPVYGQDITGMMHEHPRRAIVDYVSSGQFVVHARHWSTNKPIIGRVTRRGDRHDMAVRLRGKIEWLSGNLARHRLRHPRTEWEALSGVFEGPPPGALLMEEWRGMYGGEYASDRHALCLNTVSNCLRLEGVKSLGQSENFHDQHPGPVHELWTHGSCMMVSPAYSVGDLETYGEDTILDDIRARLAALYDFPSGPDREPPEARA